MNSTCGRLRKSLIFLVPILITTTQLAAEDTEIDGRWCEITECRGAVNPPSMITDFWTGVLFVHFDCGLYCTASTEWKFESQAKEFSELTATGTVIVSPERRLKLVRSESGPRLEFEPCVRLIWNKDRRATFDDLWVDPYADLTHLPWIESITQVCTEDPGWLWTTVNYHHEIALSDGTSFTTVKQEEPWELPWTAGTRVILIGTYQKPWFVNVSKVLERDFGCVKSHDLLQLGPR